ncbi:MAG: hypothetical protein Q4C14_08955, partial [Bacillota bacterium]|nr:hypothetical protein [Bacillota bacterium]
MRKKHILPLLWGGLLHFTICLGCGAPVLATSHVSWPQFPSITETESILSSSWTPLSEEDLDLLFADLPRYLDLGSFTLNRLNHVPIPQITPDGMILRSGSGKTYRVRIAWEALEQKLTSMISDYEGDWSIYLKDLKTGKTMEIHEHAMQSASLIKLFIAGATYELIEKGELTETDTITSALYD